MPQNLSISVNGQSQVPPGFRFHPTEEELLHYYLRKKVSYENIDLDVIRDVDLNKLEPWDIQEKCKIGTTPQNDWYFFSHKDKRYPTGTRTNRATVVGFWKATGRDKVIHSTGKQIGMRKTLVFYRGRAPHGQKSDWIMHEYRLDDNTHDTNASHFSRASDVMGDATQEEGWVVCRIFKKKNHHKTLDSSLNPSSITAEPRTQMLNSCNVGALDQILQHMGRTCQEESDANNNGYHERFMNLPSLESPNSTSSQNYFEPVVAENEGSVTNQVICTNPNSIYTLDSDTTNWAALDRLIASQLNGETETSRQLACFSDHTLACYNPSSDHPDHKLPGPRSSFAIPSNRPYHGAQDNYNSENDLWSFTTLLSSDHQCHLSNSSL